MQTLSLMAPWHIPSQPVGVVDGQVLLAPDATSADWLVKVYDKAGYLLGGEAVQAHGHFSVALLRTPVSPQLVVHVNRVGHEGVWMAHTVLQDGHAHATVLHAHEAPSRPQAPQVQSVAPCAEPPAVPKVAPVLEVTPVPEVAPVPTSVAQPEPVVAHVDAPAALDAASWLLTLRGQRVLLDIDLAHVYGVLPRRLSEQTKLNQHLLKGTDVFQLSPDEKARCVAAVARLNKLRHSVALPYAYTEAGALGLAQCLNTPLAKQRMTHVVQAFASAKARQKTTISNS